jgi:glucoamylase
MVKNAGTAPGRPGIPPRWTSSAKAGVGTSLTASSRVWFTIGFGILNEVYFPRLDEACTRDLGLIVTDGRAFFSEEKRHARHQVEWLGEGVPGYRLTNTCEAGRYRIEKEVVTDPRRDVLLQHVRFVPLKGGLPDYRLFVLLAPHLENQGCGNTGWAGDYKGIPMLFAWRGRTALALACSAPWLGRSAGFVGVSDGWQDLARHRQMTWSYERAEDGNVALTGEVALGGCGGAFVLALGFGRTVCEAGLNARESLLDGFEPARDAYVRDWQAYQHTVLPARLRKGEEGARDLYRVSAAIMRTHEAKSLPGGMVASLSFPWGQSKGDDDVGGYHLVWPRDLVEVAGGLLAAGATSETNRIVRYLQATQGADGHWPQNMWLDGRPYWTGIQMDETAFPILLVDMARREKALPDDSLADLWPMVRRAAGFIAVHGPVTGEDRWEEDPGLSPFTLAVEIAALLAAADMADQNGERGAAAYLRETADAWNDGIERWCYVEATEPAREVGVEGYYVRIAPPEIAEAASPLEGQGGFVPIKNRPPGESREPAGTIVSPDALSLVRFGLRGAHDRRIADTVRVIDALLKVETPHGPAWHRYNDDGYGEHRDGSPFDGTGVGRAWPLLTGERAHYELAAGRRDEAVRLLHAMEAFAGDGGLIPEQVWDGPDVPARCLFFGRPSGSAMPLVWAHAEYMKLRRSLADGRVFDTPPQTVRRYSEEKTASANAQWKFNSKIRVMPAGKNLRLELTAPALVRWSTDRWQHAGDIEARDTGLGVWVADLPAGRLPRGTSVGFTFRWLEKGNWEGVNFVVEIR